MPREGSKCPTPVMAGDFSTGKSILVLAIVAGCFAVLWPRVLYPMLTAGPAPPVSKEDPATRRGAPPRPLPGDMLHPAMREKANAYTQRGVGGLRGGGHPGARPPMAGGGHIPPSPTTKGSSSMSVIMPLYTVGIIVFFLYTIMKVMTKKPAESSPSSPRVKDFHMDPEQRKFVFAEEYVDRGPQTRKGPKTRRDSGERAGPREGTPVRVEQMVEQPQIEDEQMEALRLRLENTEKAMERLMTQMGSVSDKLTSAKINEVLSQAQTQSYQADLPATSSKASSVDIDDYELVTRDSSREASVAAADKDKVTESRDDSLMKKLVEEATCDETNSGKQDSSLTVKERDNAVMDEIISEVKIELPSQQHTDTAELKENFKLDSGKTEEDTTAVVENIPTELEDVPVPGQPDEAYHEETVSEQAQAVVSGIIASSQLEVAAKKALADMVKKSADTAEYVEETEEVTG